MKSLKRSLSKSISREKALKKSLSRSRSKSRSLSKAIKKGAKFLKELFKGRGSKVGSVKNQGNVSVGGSVGRIINIYPGKSGKGGKGRGCRGRSGSKSCSGSRSRSFSRSRSPRNIVVVPMNVPVAVPASVIRRSMSPRRSRSPFRRSMSPRRSPSTRQIISPFTSPWMTMGSYGPFDLQNLVDVKNLNIAQGANV